MTIRLGVVMDPLSSIKQQKDSTVAILLEAQKRNWRLYYFTHNTLSQSTNNSVKAKAAQLSIKEQALNNNQKNWYDITTEQALKLSELDIILMRKDPPFDMSYIFTTYLLEAAEREGALVINQPQSLRNCNEKLFALEFPQCTPPTLVTSSQTDIAHFLQEQGPCIIKPLNGMGGQGIFKVASSADNLAVIVDLLTEHGKLPIMAQQYLPQVQQGDKRVLLINGKPIPYALARIPQGSDIRGNLAAGGKGIGQELSERDYWICEQIGPKLRQKGLHFVGIDIIGDFLTEINVTSPTCIRELDQWFDVNISSYFLDHIETILSKK